MDAIIHRGSLAPEYHRRIVDRLSNISEQLMGTPIICGGYFNSPERYDAITVIILSQLVRQLLYNTISHHNK